MQRKPVPLVVVVAIIRSHMISYRIPAISRVFVAILINRNRNIKACGWVVYILKIKTAYYILLLSNLNSFITIISYTLLIILTFKHCHIYHEMLQTFNSKVDLIILDSKFPRTIHPLIRASTSSIHSLVKIHFIISEVNRKSSSTY